MHYASSLSTLTTMKEMFDMLGSNPCEDLDLLSSEVYIDTNSLTHKELNWIDWNASYLLHHDAITGTAWERVIQDYLNRT